MSFLSIEAPGCQENTSIHAFYYLFVLFALWMPQPKKKKESKSLLFVVDCLVVGLERKAEEGDENECGLFY